MLQNLKKLVTDVRAHVDQGRDRLAQIEERRRELESQLAEIDNAPLPIDQIMARFEERIDSTASRIFTKNGMSSSPLNSLMGKFARPGPIEFSETRWIEQTFKEGKALSSEIDNRALIAWLFKPMLMSRMREALEQSGEYDSPLTEKEREQKSSKIRSELSKLEEEERELRSALEGVDPDLAAEAWERQNEQDAEREAAIRAGLSNIEDAIEVHRQNIERSRGTPISQLRTGFLDEPFSKEELMERDQEELRQLERQRDLMKEGWQPAKAEAQAKQEMRDEREARKAQEAPVARGARNR